MPNLWGDYTTDEAADECGYTHRSNIVKRIHAKKQAATTAETDRIVYGRKWRYWSQENELQAAKTLWPKWAKKRKTEELPSAGGQPACSSLPCKKPGHPLDKPRTKKLTSKPNKQAQ